MPSTRRHRRDVMIARDDAGPVMRIIPMARSVRIKPNATVARVVRKFLLKAILRSVRAVAGRFVTDSRISAVLLLSLAAGDDGCCRR